MRIVIFGTGGAGGYFGTQLSLAGHDVIFIRAGNISVRFVRMVFASKLPRERQ